jgi:AcrR family transcriptional regulator
MKGGLSMEEKKLYRNALRSRKMIRQAFMELLQEKPYEKITATDIIRRADINRSTFYAHYPDARGIMDEIMGEITQMFQNTLDSIDFSVLFGDPMTVLTPVITFLQKNQALYEKLIRSGIVLEQLEHLKKVLIRQVLDMPSLPVADRTALGTVIRVRVLLGGLIDTYRSWLEGEISCTLEEAAAEVSDIIRTMSMESRIKLQ